MNCIGLSCVGLSCTCTFATNQIDQADDRSPQQLFFFVFCGYAATGFLLFGHQFEGMSTLQLSMMTLFMILMDFDASKFWPQMTHSAGEIAFHIFMVSVSLARARALYRCLLLVRSLSRVRSLSLSPIRARALSPARSRTHTRPSFLSKPLSPSLTNPLTVVVHFRDVLHPDEYAPRHYR
jgi:hypothetical protein